VLNTRSELIKLVSCENTSCGITVSVISTKNSKSVGQFQSKMKEFSVISSYRFYETLARNRREILEIVSQRHFDKTQPLYRLFGSS